MTTQEQVAAILTGWTVTTCADNGAFWTIAGLDPYGRAHSGSRADPIELAHDLARLVEPPPVLAPVEPAPIMATADPEPSPPAPAAVQPTLQAPASAGVEEASPASAPAAPAYPGTMLREDRENYLRGQITVRATRIEQNRLQGRFDVNAQVIRVKWPCGRIMERERFGFNRERVIGLRHRKRGYRLLAIPHGLRGAVDQLHAAGGLE
jgi:hypothetical protein